MLNFQVVFEIEVDKSLFQRNVVESARLSSWEGMLVEGGKDREMEKIWLRRWLKKTRNKRGRSPAANNRGQGKRERLDGSGGAVTDEAND